MKKGLLIILSFITLFSSVSCKNKKNSSINSSVDNSSSLNEQSSIINSSSTTVSDNGNSTSSSSTSSEVEITYTLSEPSLTIDNETGVVTWDEVV